MQVSVFDLALCLSRALDLIDPTLVAHHERVAYISWRIAQEAGLPLEEESRIILAGLLHDSGALSLTERMGSLAFEVDHPQHHAEVGYRLLKDFSHPAFSFQEVAEFVRFHHAPWREHPDVPLGSQILHLADRIAVLIGNQREVLSQAEEIVRRIDQQAGLMFSPDLVAVFHRLALKESFWLYSAQPPLQHLREHREWEVTDLDGLLGMARLCGKIIDFRSSFTATHSSGVSAVAVAVARYANMSEEECAMMRVAGFLHDLGKLAVPSEILEKPGKLTKEEFEVIRSHTFFTYETLDALPELKTINSWASFHHERLDGRGYPFHHGRRELSLGARIMAVADVFTAITEDRPYRAGMEQDAAVRLLEKMAFDGALDENVVALLASHASEIADLRAEVQTQAESEYRGFERGASLVAASQSEGFSRSPS
ncbi:MAG: HD-GYP domain-containing protein [Bacteroidota bacterium]